MRGSAGFGGLRRNASGPSRAAMRGGRKLRARPCGNFCDAAVKPTDACLGPTPSMEATVRGVSLPLPYGRGSELSNQTADDKDRQRYKFVQVAKRLRCVVPTDII
jgi:hypothetical protein